ncbi:MAG: hypothetical protein V1758_03005 [Pseudomonadota bacterium]
MDIARKIGIGIVMIVPSFVGSGALWNIFHSWVAVAVWVAIMAAVAGAIISGRFTKGLDAG